MEQKKLIGNLGEDIACQFLIMNNYAILEKNYTNKQGKRLGEVDIIAQSKNGIHFIEVKTRTDKKTAIFPEEAINKNKLLKIRKISQHFIKNRNLWDINYQFDAISIIIKNDTKIASVKHLKNIFL